MITLFLAPHHRLLIKLLKKKSENKSKMKSEKKLKKRSKKSKKLIMVIQTLILNQEMQLSYLFQ